LSKCIFPQDEIVHYTDPAGNTFEAPVVKIDTVDLNENTKMAVIVSEEPVFSLEPTPEDHAQIEAEEAVVVAPWEEQPEEADLDLKGSVAETKEDDSSDFDLDFGSDDPEDDEVDNTPDFF